MKESEYEAAIKGSLARYRRRQALHYAVLLLYGGVVLGRPLCALARNFRRFGNRAVPLLLLTLLFLGPPLAFYCWYTWKYHRAIARLAAGNLLEVTGEVLSRNGRKFVLREKGLGKGGGQSSGAVYTFRLCKRGGSWEPRPGDRVTVFYPASRLLWVGEPEAVFLLPREM